MALKFYVLGDNFEDFLVISNGEGRGLLNEEHIAYLKVKHLQPSVKSQEVISQWETVFEQVLTVIHQTPVSMVCINQSYL